MVTGTYKSAMAEALSKHSKASVDYSKGKPHAHCGICEHYRRDNSCELVSGVIKPEMWCKLFEAK